MLGKAARNAVLLVLVFVLASAAASAQAPDVALVYHPGDKVTVGVSFKDPIALDGGDFILQLQGEIHPGQQGFTPSFSGGELKKISDREYEISGRIPDTIASGSFRLQVIDAATEGVGRRYVFGTDFTTVITIRIENSKHVQFPDIKDVVVRP